MTRFDDDEDVRADELLSGRALPGREPLAAVLGQLRALADEPAPAPTPALAAVLREGLPVAALDHPAAAAGARPLVLRGLRWAAGLGIAGKVLLGAGVAAAAVAGTATLPVVPDSVQVPVRTALSDLGHLIPGSAGGSVPVPSATTPEPVDGVVTPVDPPSAGPAHTQHENRGQGDGASRDPGSSPRGRSGDQDQQQPGRPSGSQDQQQPGTPSGSQDQQQPGAPSGSQGQQGAGTPSGSQDQQGAGRAQGGDQNARGGGPGSGNQGSGGSRDA